MTSGGPEGPREERRSGSAQPGHGTWPRCGPEKAKGHLGKAADAANNATGGKYEEHVDKAETGAKSGKGWQVVHRCTACGHRQPNRLVREGSAPDDLDLVLSLPWL